MCKLHALIYDNLYKQYVLLNLDDFINIAFKGSISLNMFID